MIKNKKAVWKIYSKLKRDIISMVQIFKYNISKRDRARENRLKIDGGIVDIT